MGQRGVPTPYNEEMAIVSEWAESGNASEVARRHGVTPKTVTRIVERYPEVIRDMRSMVVSHLEEGLTRAVLEYCGSRGILDPEKIKGATLQQVMTSLGIGIDKIAQLQGAPSLVTPEDIPADVRAIAEAVLKELRAQAVPAEVVDDD